MFVQSETQRNALFRMLFAKRVHLHYISLEKRLIGLLKAFEVFTIGFFLAPVLCGFLQKCIKKPPVLTIESLSASQESHPGVVRFKSL
jgi:hypothetical protein